MHFVDFLHHSRRKIDETLNRVFNTWQKEIKSTSPKLLPLTKIFISSMAGGKKLRGTLVKLGYCLIDQKYPREIYTAAAAYEIFQTAILIHDDIIDKSRQRRGKKTIYRLLGNNHYGVSQAINLGDLGFFLALKVLVSTNFPQPYKGKALQLFIETIHETILGEMLDVEEAYGEKIISEEEIINIYRNKTAKYTITGPLELGAILAGVKESDLRQIRLFGENLGIAYQIQDDILGTFGEEKIVGKPVFSDIKEGKKTLLYIQARRRAKPEQIATLDKFYGQNEITINNGRKIKKIFIDTGSLVYTKNKVTQYFKKAGKNIHKLGDDKEVQMIIRELMDYLARRIN